MTTLLIVLGAMLYAVVLVGMVALFAKQLAEFGTEGDPVPITPKMLEKIGFKRSEVLVEWKYEREDVYMLWKPFPWIRIQTNYSDMTFPCEYVHQLRQALELAQIDINVNWEEL